MDVLARERMGLVPSRVVSTSPTRPVMCRTLLSCMYVFDNKGYVVLVFTGPVGQGILGQISTSERTNEEGTENPYCMWLVAAIRQTLPRIGTGQCLQGVAPGNQR